MTGHARVERLHDWFALQLDFADVFAMRSGIALDASITFYTNLCRRFGFERPAYGVALAPEWQAFVQRLAAQPTRAVRLALTMEFATERLPYWPSTVGTFGCFSFDPPKEGAVRIHFSPGDKGGGVGPLSRDKYRKRVDELAAMFACVRREHPDARYVQGGSWLYNVEAYRRLFPPAYIRSVTPHTAPRDLTGGSWWGQFIDHQEHVRADQAATFRQRLSALDPACMWRVFPLPAMSARADIEVFYDHYGAVATDESR